MTIVMFKTMPAAAQRRVGALLRQISPALSRAHTVTSGLVDAPVVAEQVTNGAIRIASVSHDVDSGLAKVALSMSTPFQKQPPVSIELLSPPVYLPAYDIDKLELEGLAESQREDLYPKRAFAVLKNTYVAGLIAVAYSALSFEKAILMDHWIRALFAVDDFADLSLENHAIVEDQVNRKCDSV
jgi:hypothetical protein